jgi:hypothetical protein
MVHPHHALAVYAESLATDRRVAVLGDSSVGLGERMLDLGARSVLLWDPDEERAAREAERAPYGVAVRALTLDEARHADMRPGSVDLALVTDLAMFDDPQGVLAMVKRAVGDRGVALVAAANRDVVPGDVRAFDYYELFDLVAAEFEDVRMVAQLPFTGVALAELGRDEEAPAVSVDTQLVEAGRAPEAFVAVATSGGANLEPYAIVELPAQQPAPAEAGDDEGTRALLARAQLEAQALEGQLDEMRARLAQVEHASAAAVATQAEQLGARAERMTELEQALADRAAQLAELSVEVEEMRSAAEAGQVAAAQVEELALRADRAERALMALQPELSRVGEAHAAEHARFEEALRDRAQAIRALEAELARRERMVRELVDALEENTAQPAPAADDAVAQENLQLRQKLDALALELAHREGEAQAAAWTLAELERRVAEASTRAVAAAPSGALAPATPPSGALAPATPPSGALAPATPASGALAAATPASSGDLERRLAAALDELDVLRQAVAQEHAERVRAESGEELERARAEIQRQAALLEQLGHGDRAEGPALHPSGK